MSLANRTVLITGASRGIGKEIGLCAAAAGANVVILAKTVKPHPKLPGTIYTAAEEMTRAGGRALPIATDIRDQQQVLDATEKAVAEFGGIDILVNNASAIFLASTLQTPLKRFDLMHAVNARGTFLTTQACLPYLLNSDNAHVLNIAPPLNLAPRWFGPHVAYSMAKFGMSLCVLGMAEEFKQAGIAINALWPKTAIATAAVQNLLGGDEAIRRCRKPSIMADAAMHVITRPSGVLSGQFLIDEDVLRTAGVTDFDQYAVDPTQPLMNDFFVDREK